MIILYICLYHLNCCTEFLFKQKDNKEKKDHQNKHGANLGSTVTKQIGLNVAESQVPLPKEQLEDQARVFPKPFFVKVLPIA